MVTDGDTETGLPGIPVSKTPDFGPWAKQVNAIAIAHYLTAIAHFCIIFFIRGIWDKSVAYAVDIIGAIAMATPAENRTVLEEMQKLDYFVYIFWGVIVVFTFFIAWNGVLLKRGVNGARIGGIVLGAFLIFAFPIGTFVGIWFIYVLVQREVADACNPKKV